ncbi:cytochrome P450, partial [Micromonospora sp. M51]|uniref:cytochrome P450 n=1 Tax=Micromonospora sp. M51 TaxID=2824889 RepID=UPI001FFDA3C2
SMSQVSEARSATVSTEPRTIPARRALPALVRDPLGALVDFADAAAGEVVRLNLGSFRPYLVSHPEHLQRVLRDNVANYIRDGDGLLWRPVRRIVGDAILVAEGAVWESSRGALQPLFTAKRAETLVDKMAEAINEAVDEWLEPARTGRPIDGGAELTRIVLRTTMRVLFADRISVPDALRISAALDTLTTAMLPRLVMPAVPYAVPMPRDRQVREAVRTAHDEHTTAVAALVDARAVAERADADLEAAFRAHEEAKATDLAVSLRVHLHAGATCPVCEQPVAEVPAVPADSAVAAATAAGKAARAATKAAQETVRQRDAAARELERLLVQARARQEQLEARLAELDGQLSGAAEPAVLRRELAEHARLRRALDEAATAVRAGRETARQARAAVDAAEERLRAAWRAFDTARDGLARFGPPATDRDDVAAAWSTLTGWATSEADRRRADRDGRAAAVAAAESVADGVQRAIAAIFADADVPVGDDPVHAATVAVERADADRRRLHERREQAGALREQRAGHEREAQVARALAGHLRANNFERWLLAEALDLLVDGASGILRELSNGQYELVHDKGEFVVVDHHDAGLRRGVRTLSGGETFQASLALALALSEQLAGMSTTAASLESIVLDEGFGTLDAATLDTVAATLENLAARGDRMVGVVTHVPALAERIPVRFEVRKDARSARVERTGR